MVQVVQFAVVVIAVGGSGVEEWPAEELAFDGAGSPAGLQAVGLKVGKQAMISSQRMAEKGLWSQLKKVFEKDEQLIGFSVHQLGIPEMEKL